MHNSEKEEEEGGTARKQCASSAVVERISLPLFHPLSRFVISANFAMFVKSGNEGCGVEISFDIVKQIPLFQFRFRLIIKISD